MTTLDLVAPRCLSRTGFEEIASDYDQLWTARLYDGAILRALPPHPSLVVDLGCGAGTLTRKLAARARRVVGVDASQRAIQLAQEKAATPNVDFRVGAIEAVASSIPPSSCDAIVASRSLHHCLPLEPIVEDLVSLLAPGGTFVAFELRATGSEAGGNLARLAIAAAYRFSVLVQGAHSGCLPAAVKGLLAERRLATSDAWQAHLRDEPDFHWTFLASALRSSGLAVTASRINVRFRLLVGKRP